LLALIAAFAGTAAASRTANVPPPPPGVRIILEQGGFAYISGEIKTRRLVLGKNRLYRLGTGMRWAFVYAAEKKGDRVRFHMATQADSRGAAFWEATAIRAIPARRHALERHIAGPGARVHITSVRAWHRYLIVAIRTLS
jgi:hypothetical protein